MGYLIERDNRAGRNGRWEGPRRYVKRAHYCGPDVGYAWTGTVDPDEATMFPTRDAAEQAASEHGWTGTTVVNATDAPRLSEWAEEGART